MRVCIVLVVVVTVLPIIVWAQRVPVQEIMVTDNIVLYKTGETNAYPNMIVASTKKGIVVFDTHAMPEVAKKVRGMIEKRFGAKVVFVINTHAWYDHTNGNVVFKDVPAIAHDSARSELSFLIKAVKGPQAKERARKGVEQLMAYKSKYPGNPKDVDEAIEIEKARANVAQLDGMIPGIRFSDRMTLDVGNMTLRLYYNTPSYSTSDIIIEIPEEHTLVVGDIFNTNRLPWLDRQTDYAAMNALFAPFLADNSTIDHFIGTHGYELKKSEIIEQMKYINRLREDVMAKKNASKSLDDIRKELDLKHFGYLSSYNPIFNGTGYNLHDNNINAIWRSLGGEMPRRQ